MDRRSLLLMLGVGGLLALPLGCGPKKAKDGESTPDEDAPAEMKGAAKGFDDNPEAK